MHEALVRGSVHEVRIDNSPKDGSAIGVHCAPLKRIVVLEQGVFNPTTLLDTAKQAPLGDNNVQHFIFRVPDRAAFTSICAVSIQPARYHG